MPPFGDEKPAATGWGTNQELWIGRVAALRFHLNLTIMWVPVLSKRLTFDNNSLGHPPKWENGSISERFQSNRSLDLSIAAGH